MNTHLPRVRVRVPATSANLGPGFDTLGLALDIYNVVEIGEAVGKHDLITYESAQDDGLPRDATNIALMAARLLLRSLEAPSVPLHLHLENTVPLSRGLGSSAAARVGALVAANLWAGEMGWGSVETNQLLSLATQLEGHPDNAAAALLGGLTIAVVVDEEGGKALATRLAVRRFPRLVVFVPDSELATSEARGVLPDMVFRAQANFNIARSSLLLAALANEQWELLPLALQDRLHQKHRAGLMPGFEAIVQATCDAGAYGATLSGAGPTILAWLPHREDIVAETRQALSDAAAAHEVFGKSQEVQVDLEGCVQV